MNNIATRAVNSFMIEKQNGEKEIGQKEMGCIGEGFSMNVKIRNLHWKSGMHLKKYRQNNYSEMRT